MTLNNKIKTVLVTGGAGYVGSALVPMLLKEGYRTKVLDLYMFGEDVFSSCASDKNLIQIKGDIRNQDTLEEVLSDCDAVIHLACISNDPCFELDPDLGKSINFDSFEPLVKLSKAAGVKRFIYASSSSVYGVSDEENVDENHPLHPLTDYSKYKGMCEPILLAQQAPGFTTTVIRPATVCGYAPRQRLDLSVNILTNHAVNTEKITIFGGEQKRPNIHIKDMVDLYVMLLKLPDQLIAGKIYNAGYENQSIAHLAETVKSVVQKNMPDKADLRLVVEPTEDLRSYHISSKKIREELGFTPQHSIEEAVADLVSAFKKQLLPNPMTDDRYFNIKTMQKLKL